MVAVLTSREAPKDRNLTEGSASHAGVLRKHGGSGTVPRAWLSLYPDLPTLGSAFPKGIDRIWVR